MSTFSDETLVNHIALVMAMAQTLTPLLMVHHLGLNNSLLNQFVAELRNVEVQGDRLRFRRNLERIGEIMAYEISKLITYDEVEITTPLGVAVMNIPKEQPVIGTILRAGLPLHQGFLN